jgi:Pectate lyase superfamily protein
MNDLGVSVKDRGAIGDGTSDDTASIQRTINEVQGQGGGNVFFPVGRYKTTASLRVSTGSVGLLGLGGGCVVAPEGNFDTFVFESLSPATHIYYNRFSDLVIDEQGKTGGRLLAGEHNAQFISERIVAYGGWSGMTFNNFNNVTLFHLRLTDYRGGPSAYYVRLTGGIAGVGRSDVAFIMRGVFGGSRSLGMRGLDIDGFVHTVNGWACHFINIGGEGLHARNTVGATNVPSFITMDDFECDYPELECVRLDVGVRMFFNNSQLNGSRSRSGIYIADGVKSCTFTGGFVSGSREAGIAIAGQDVAVTGMNFLFNSSDEFGGSRGVFPGILLGGTSRGSVVTGCRSGDAAHSDYQRYGCQVDTGADDFVVVGNNFRNNVKEGVINGAGSSRRKLISHNIEPKID